LGASLVPFPSDCKQYSRQRKRTSGNQSAVAASQHVTSEAAAEPGPNGASCPTCGAPNTDGSCDTSGVDSGSVFPVFSRSFERQTAPLQPPKADLDAFETLNILNIGVVVTNQSRRVLFTNQTAQQMLAAQNGLEVIQGVIGTQRGCCSPSLAEVAQAASQPGKRQSGAAVLAVKRRFGKRHLTLLLRRILPTSSLTNVTGRAFLIFLLDPELPVQSTEAELNQLYGLTSSEARLANLLMEGKTLEDCCQELNIRISTGRMHLGNLFAKTGVQRQGQLISLLLKSVGLVRMGWNVESEK
jgi:DNA-binding CsgD family transcriptional regulator